jgi:hypothetical protein
VAIEDEELTVEDAEAVDGEDEIVEEAVDEVIVEEAVDEVIVEEAVDEVIVLVDEVAGFSVRRTPTAAAATIITTITIAAINLPIAMLFVNRRIRF